jgi:hypothetical protein
LISSTNTLPSPIPHLRRADHGGGRARLLARPKIGKGCSPSRASRVGTTFVRCEQRHPAGEKCPGGSRACIMLTPASRPRRKTCATCTSSQGRVHPDAVRSGSMGCARFLEHRVSGSRRRRSSPRFWIIIMIVFARNLTCRKMTDSPRHPVAPKMM